MGRLAVRLGRETTSRLARAVADHVVETVQESGLLTTVVTGDDDVREWAARHDLVTVPDPGSGLDGAAATGAATNMAGWLVLHSDLPLLSTDEVEKLADVVASGRSVLSPSADGGTSAIGSTDPIAFQYGPGSFHRHLGRLEDPTILVRPGLSLDIDRYDDLVAAADHQRGMWLRPFIA